VHPEALAVADRVARSAYPRRIRDAFAESRRALADRPALHGREAAIAGRLRVAMSVVIAIVIAVLLLVSVAELWVMVHNPSIIAMAGNDYDLYMGATRRWLAGGAFYPAWQLAGPYTADAWPILYPPVALVLFVPFTVLPTILWFAVPIAATVGIVAWHRPRPWAWAVMLAMFAFFPLLFLPYVSGTPTIWVIAALALATRWPAWSALILVKPTLAPLALIGVRDRRWWILVLALALVSLALLPMTIEWIRSVLNLTGDKAGLLYSMENVPLVIVPLAAWAGSTRRTADPARGARPTAGATLRPDG
jgi:hypothetical protein